MRTDSLVSVWQTAQGMLACRTLLSGVDEVPCVSYSTRHKWAIWLWCVWRGTEVFLACRGCHWSLPLQCIWPHSTCIDQGAPVRTHCLPPPGVNHTTGLQPWVLFCPWLSDSIDHKLQILYRLVVRDMRQQL